MKILLVENDVNTIRFIQKAMNVSKHELVHENNGVDGYKNAMHGDHEVIIVDRIKLRLGLKSTFVSPGVI